MAIVGSAEITIGADTKQFDVALTKSEQKLQQLAAKQAGFSLSNFNKLHAQALRENAALAKGATGSSNALKKFNGLIDGAETSLQRFGFTTRDVSVLMGAGLAGGFAFAAREVFRFAAAAIEAASALQEQESAAEAVFQTSSKLVETFAENASAMGLSERAALAASNAFGTLFTNIGLPEESAAKLSIGLTALAADLASFKDLPVDEVLTKLSSGLVGEIEPLRSLGVIFDQTEVKARGAADGLTDAHGELTKGEEVLIRYKLILEKTGLAQGDVERTSDSLANKQRELNAEYENASAALGEGLQPAATAATKVLTELAKGVSAVVASTEETESGLDRLKRVITTFSPLVPLPVKGFLALRDSQSDAADSSDELAEAARILGLSETELAVALGGTTDSAEDQTDALEDLKEATSRLDRAKADAARNELRAKENLNRALQDVELREDEAERNLSEALKNRTKAEREANQRIRDTQLSNFRSVRDARERLADFEEESARRVVDAEERILDIRREQTRAIISSLIDLERAQASGDAEAENRAARALREAQDNEAISDAKREAAEEEKNTDKERARLRRDLSEAIQDAERAEAEAREDKADAIESADQRIADSERRLTDVRRDNARQVTDAQNRLNDAIRDGGEATGDLQKKVDSLTASLKEARKETKGLTKDLQALRDIFLNSTEGGPEGSVRTDMDLEDILRGFGLEHGGRALKDHAYVVGEAGPELHIPTTSGTVVSNDQVIAALRDMTGAITSGSGGSSVSIYTASTDPRVLANEIGWLLANGVNR